jgi:hypothetical protein
MQLAGGEEATILSIVGAVLLPMFSTREACTLRLLCREFTQAVREYQWEDKDTLIKGEIRLWRACFPRARAANVCSYLGPRYRRVPVVDADFVHFVGLRELNMAGCKEVTDAAFAHLAGIHTLNMCGCRQATITDAAFVHLKGIHTLNMRACFQATITDAAFVHLQGIHTLDMSWCSQDFDEAFASSLAGVHELLMYDCSAQSIAAARKMQLRVLPTLQQEHAQEQQEQQQQEEDMEQEEEEDLQRNESEEAQHVEEQMQEQAVQQLQNEQDSAQMQEQAMQQLQHEQGSAQSQLEDD